MTGHRCHAKLCKNPCPPRHLMCATCWSIVPADLRSEVYATVGQRKSASPDASWAPWWRAQGKATNVVYLKNHPTMKFDAGYMLEKDMLFADYLEGKVPAADYEARRATMREKWARLANDHENQKVVVSGLVSLFTGASDEKS
jgi:hypothetical protein